MGGFTSFASFAFFTAESHWSIALAYVAATLVGCTAAYLAGDKLR